MSLTNQLTTYFSSVSKGIDLIDGECVDRVIQRLVQCYEAQGTLYVFGNGGSGASAAHFAGDMLRVLSKEGVKRFRAVCLNDNSPALMAIANDVCYEDVFKEVLVNYLKPNDVVLGLTGSGNSENIVRALTVSNVYGCTSMVLCGFNGGKVKSIADIVVHVPVEDMEVVEDLHMMILHSIKREFMDRYL